jgi:hypothetical protein
MSKNIIFVENTTVYILPVCWEYRNSYVKFPMISRRNWYQFTDIRYIWSNLKTLQQSSLVIWIMTERKCWNNIQLYGRLHYLHVTYTIYTIYTISLTPISTGTTHNQVFSVCLIVHNQALQHYPLYFRLRNYSAPFK